MLDPPWTHGLLNDFLFLGPLNTQTATQVVPETGCITGGQWFLAVNNDIHKYV